MFRLPIRDYTGNISLPIPARFAILIIVLPVVIMLSLMVGSVYIPFGTVFRVVLSQVPFLGSHYAGSFSPEQYEIVVLLREPQILGAAVIGASLGVGGAVIQSIFKNPITEPYVIGISSGAALGAVIAITGTFDIFGIYSLSISSFAFSLLVVYLVYFLSLRHGRVPVVYLLLMGVAISLFVSSLVAFMIFNNVRLQGQVFFWLMGSLQELTWDKLAIIFIINSLMIFVAVTFSKELDAFQMGEEYAKSVGVRAEMTKLVLVSVIALGVSACVAVSGLIGFVGLVIPHVSRLIYGGANRRVVPASAALGGIFLVLAEDLAHSSLFGGEVIPIGIITSLIGVPFFMFLLTRLSGGSYDT